MQTVICEMSDEVKERLKQPAMLVTRLKTVEVLRSYAERSCAQLSRNPAWTSISLLVPAPHHAGDNPLLSSQTMGRVFAL